MTTAKDVIDAIEVYVTAKDYHLQGRTTISDAPVREAWKRAADLLEIYVDARIQAALNDFALRQHVVFGKETPHGL